MDRREFIKSVGVAGSQSDEGFSASRAREFDYDHYGFVAKFGALLDYPSFAAGLTLTAPSVNVYGTGTMTYADIVIIDQPGSDPPLIAVAAPDDLSATHRKPLSLGLGVRGRGAKFQFYGSAEWFASIDEYDVMRSGLFDAQSSTGQFEYVISDERTSVLNWAVAVEGQLGEGGPAGIGRRLDLLVGRAGRETLGLGALAVVTAEWGQRQRQQSSLP